MKNKKVIIAITAIAILFFFIFLGYYISSKVILKDKDDKSNTTKIEESEEIKNDNIKNIDEKNNNEKDYENVVLTSKIGNEVLSKFSVSNIYSKILYDAIDNNGLNDETKLIFTYVTIVTNYDYHNMIKSSEELGEYITKEDFEAVYKSLFGKNSNIEHKSVITDTLYNKEKECYEYLTFGYGGIEFNFIVEVPYEIKEYEDRLEVVFYRLYGTSTSELKKDGTQEQKVTLYNNNLKSTEVYSGSEVELQDNDSQNSYIKDLIDDNKINKEELEKVTYTLIKEDDNYYIKDVMR